MSYTKTDLQQKAIKKSTEEWLARIRTKVSELKKGYPTTEKKKGLEPASNSSQHYDRCKMYFKITFPEVFKNIYIKPLWRK